MAGFWKGTMCAVLGLACSVSLAQNTDQQRDSKDSHDKEHKAAQNHQQGQRQTIRGTIAGVTAVGEAVIDPQTNTAIVAEVDYLTILGSPAKGGEHADHGDKAQQDKNQADQDQGQADQSRQAGSKDKMSQRQNVYLVAITPETKVKLANGGLGASSDQSSDPSSDQSQKNSQDKSQSASDQSAGDSESQQAFDKLEIGDKVRVEFVSTGRMRGKMDKNSQASNSDKSDEGTTRTAGFRGTGSQHKHGRHRIMIGQAKSITITSMPSANEDKSSSDQDQNKDQK